MSTGIRTVLLAAADVTTTTLTTISDAVELAFAGVADMLTLRMFAIQEAWMSELKLVRQEVREMRDEHKVMQAAVLELSKRPLCAVCPARLLAEQILARGTMAAAVGAAAGEDEVAPTRD